jgi:septal ring factor EnvC (AmiA/AmiB activator)
MDTEGLSFLDEKKDEDNSALFMDEDESEANDDGKYKVVKFAEDEAQKHDAERDQERSRQELLSKIARLTESFSEAQQQIKDEKDKRKKKEKSLLKLAKELKKRNLAREKDEDRLEEVCRGKCVVLQQCPEVVFEFRMESNCDKRIRSDSAFCQLSMFIFRKLA